MFKGLNDLENEGRIKGTEYLLSSRYTGLG